MVPPPFTVIVTSNKQVYYVTVRGSSILCLYDGIWKYSRIGWPFTVILPLPALRLATAIEVLRLPLPQALPLLSSFGYLSF